MNHIELGQKGERIAEEFLIGEGVIVLDKNYRWKREEIDLIIQDENSLVFVEVKTRKHDSYAAPEKAVSRTKQRHLIKAANAYIQEKRIDLDVRFDIVSIVHNSYKTRIKHIRNAFYPTL